MSKPNIIITHQDADGLLSASIVSRCLHDTDFAIYRSKGGGGDVIPAATKQHCRLAFLLDCSPKPDAMKELLSAAEKLVWIDHHAEAAPIEKELPNIQGLRSSTMSACALTYSWCYGIREVERMPKLVRVVHYNDVGEFNNEDVTAFSAYYRSTLPSVTDFRSMLKHGIDIEIGLGRRLERATRKHMAGNLSRTFRATYNKGGTKLNLLCVNGFAPRSLFDTCHDVSLDAFFGFQRTSPARVDIVLYRPPWRPELDMREVIKYPSFTGAAGKGSSSVKDVSFNEHGEMHLYW